MKQETKKIQTNTDKTEKVIEEDAQCGQSMCIIKFGMYFRISDFGMKIVIRYLLHSIKVVTPLESK